MKRSTLFAYSSLLHFFGIWNCIMISDIDDCDPNPCEHGTCTDGIDDYNCTCESGWTGVNCSISNSLHHLT